MRRIQNCEEGGEEHFQANVDLRRFWRRTVDTVRNTMTLSPPKTTLQNRREEHCEEHSWISTFRNTALAAEAGQTVLTSAKLQRARTWGRKDVKQVLLLLRTHLVNC